MAIFDTLLVPIDGSAPSDAGAALARDIAASYGGRLTFVHVVDGAALSLTGDYVSPDSGATVGEATTAAETLLDVAVAGAREQGLTAEAQLFEGPVVDRLLDAIAQTRATTVVIGSHGRGGIARLVLGSTADGLLRRAAVPVLVARHTS
jgi:nucleotide-binding universal stress UspA family protein